VPSLIGLPNGKTQRGYWTISYMGGNPAGLFYAGSEPAPALDASKLVGFKGVREVLRNYSGRVMDACAGLGGIPIEAAKLGMPSINNELNPQRMATALQRMSKVIKKEPVRL
jgi:hypothetical protein